MSGRVLEVRISVSCPVVVWIGVGFVVECDDGYGHGGGHVGGHGGGHGGMD